jgi:UDP-N-acetylglucosamine--N-acetylmuramyl-(pentapeptide) pyrophosphoryl-undecaprenol N-acetylglucosamine transferase
MTAGAVSKKMITEFAPDIVVGTGGYVTAPVLRAAAKLGVKTVAHESNSLPGLATKMLVGVADKVLVSNADTLKHFDSVNHPSNAGKFVVTGNPLRGEFRKQERRGSALESLKLTGGMTILSFGGSLGANAISRGVIDLIKWGRDKSVNHIHAYGGNGKGLFEKLLKDNDIPPEGERYIFAEYIHNMYTCIAAADIVICRSGSMSQTELKAFGRASIQIPWSGAAENHQYYNALTMHKAGAAILIEDRELSGAKLVEVVEQLYNDRLRIRLMEENAARMSSPNAAGLIVSEMMDLTSNS